MSTAIIPQNETAVIKIAPKDSKESDEFLAMMERLAMADVDVVKIEKMMDLHERMQDRNARMAFSSALAAMQSEIPEINQNGEIKHDKKLISKYAKFEDINGAVKPVLKDHGFAISFRIKQAESKIEVTAILSHREGHSEETSMTLPADTGGAKNAVQAQGSTVAYGKRYTMCALLNISSRGEDDDGKGSDIIDTEQAAILDNLVRSTSADRNAFHSFFKIDDVRNLRTKDYSAALQMLKKKEKKGGAV